MDGRLVGRLIAFMIAILFIVTLPQTTFANSVLETNYIEIDGKVVVHGGNPVGSIIFIEYGNINRTIEVLPDGSFHTSIFTNETTILNITAISPYGLINRSYEITELPYHIFTTFTFNATNIPNIPSPPSISTNTSAKTHNITYSPDFIVSFYIKNKPVICGDKITLRIVVRNIGSYYPTVTYSILVDNSIVANRMINFTGYAYQTTLNISSPNSHGEHSIKIIVDPNNNIKELREDNNFMGMKFFAYSFSSTINSAISEINTALTELKNLPPKYRIPVKINLLRAKFHLKMAKTHHPLIHLYRAAQNMIKSMKIMYLARLNGYYVPIDYVYRALKLTGISSYIKHRNYSLCTYILNIQSAFYILTKMETSYHTEITKYFIKTLKFGYIYSFTGRIIFLRKSYHYLTEILVESNSLKNSITIVSKLRLGGIVYAPDISFKSITYSDGNLTVTLQNTAFTTAENVEVTVEIMSEKQKYEFVFDRINPYSYASQTKRVNITSGIHKINGYISPEFLDSDNTNNIFSSILNVPPPGITAVRGDLWIDTRVILENGKSSFYGNITINSTGELILRNYSLWVVTPLNEIIRHVTVYGKLVIENNSNLTSTYKDVSYWLYVYGEMYVRNNSKVQMMYGNETIGGIIAYSGSKISIENSSVMDGRTYDMYAESANISARNIAIINEKHDTFERYHGAHIENMNIHWNYIHMENGTIDVWNSNAVVENLTARNCSSAILSSDSNITVKNSIIYVENSGVSSKNRNYPNITVINTKFVGKGFPTIDYREGDKAVVLVSADSFRPDSYYTFHNGALVADGFYYYFTLKNHSWSDENITFMLYSGHLGKYKNSYGQVTRDANFIDANRNNILDFKEAEIDYKNDSVTPENFTSVLNTIATSMLPDSEILIVMENHGWYNETNGTHYFKFEYNTSDLSNPFHKLWAPTMQSTLDLFNQRNIKVKLMVFTCASGGFVESVAVPGTLYVAEVSDKQTGLAYYYDGPSDTKYGTLFGHHFFKDLNAGMTIFDAYMKNRYIYQGVTIPEYRNRTPVLGEYSYLSGKYGVYCFNGHVDISNVDISNIETGISIDQVIGNFTNLIFERSGFSYSEGNAGIYSRSSSLQIEKLSAENMCGPSIYAIDTTLKLNNSTINNQSYGSGIVAIHSQIDIYSLQIINLSSRNYGIYMENTNITATYILMRNLSWGAFSSSNKGWCIADISNSEFYSSGNSYLINSTLNFKNITAIENTRFQISSSILNFSYISLLNTSSIEADECYKTTLNNIILKNISTIVIQYPYENITANNLRIIQDSEFRAEGDQSYQNISILITNITGEKSNRPIATTGIKTYIKNASIKDCGNIGIRIINDFPNPGDNEIIDTYFYNCTVGLDLNASATVYNLSALNSVYGVMLEYIHTVYVNSSYFSYNQIGIYAGPSPFVERGKLQQQFNLINITMENNTYGLYMNKSQVAVFIDSSIFLNNTYQIYSDSSELYLNRCTLKSFPKFKFHRFFIATWKYGSKTNIFLNSSEAFITNTTIVQAEVSICSVNGSFANIFNSSVSGGEITEPVLCLYGGWKYSCFARIKGEAIYLNGSDIIINNSKITGVRGIVIENTKARSEIENTSFEVKAIYGEIWRFDWEIGIYLLDGVRYTGNCIEIYNSAGTIIQNSLFNNSVIPVYASAQGIIPQKIDLQNITVENSTNGIIVKNSEIILQNSTILNIEKDGLYIRNETQVTATVDNTSFKNCSWAIHSIGINVTMKNVIFGIQREGRYLLEYFLYVYVYNKTTYQPITRATVKIYNSTGVKIAQEYTDKKGYAEFILRSMSIDNYAHQYIYYPYEVVATYSSATNYTWLDLTENTEISLGL